MAEADKLKYVKISSSEKSLDQTLDELDSLIGKLDAKNQIVAVQILTLMDELHSRLKGQLKLDQEGMPENSQLGYLYTQIRKQAPTIVKAVGGSEYFQIKRQGQDFSKFAWWWYLDEYVVQKQKRSLVRMFRGFVIFAVVLLIAVFAYQRWLAPPPEVRARLGFENQASLAIEDGRYADALVAINEALTFGPEQYSLWI